MAKIVLDPVTNGATLSTLNANFDKIEAEFQNRVAYRDNPSEETNTIKNDMDHDGNDIFNVNTLDIQELVVQGIPVPGSDLGGLPALRQDVTELQVGLGQTNTNVTNLTNVVNQNAAVEDLHHKASLRTSGGPIEPLSEIGDRAGKFLAFDAVGNPISSFGTGADLGLRSDLTASSGSSMVGFIQSGPGAVHRLMQSKLREIGYTPYDVGAVGDGVADDTVALQTWADNINLLGIRYARCEGVFKTSANLNWVFGQEKRIDFNARINANHTSDGYIISITNSRLCTLAGRLVVAGGGGTNYALRTNGNGVLLDGVFHGSLDVLEARNVRHWGVTIRSDGDFSTFFKINRLHNYLCGTSGSGGTGLLANFTARSDSGASGVPSQRSELTVDALPSLIEAQDFISYSGRPYVVTAVDRPNMKITVYPWLPIGDTTGAIIYGVGGGLRVSGANAAGLCIGLHTTSACGNGYQNRALYSGATDYFSSEFNEIATSLGAADSGAIIGGRIGVLYAEGNRHNFVKTTVFTDTAFEVGPRVDATNGANDFYLLPRLNTGAFNTGLGRGGLTAMHPRGFQVDSAQFGRFSGANTVTLSLGGGGAPLHVERRNSATVTLNAAPMATNVGHTSCMVGFIGTGGSKQPTGILTFNPEAGYTVNGSTSAAFSTFTGPVIFFVVLVGTDWQVAKVIG